MNHYSIALSYTGVFALLFILFYTGLLIFKRASSEIRPQLLIPAGSIFGICMYIFFLNLTAHFVKGMFGFFLALATQIIITFVICKLYSVSTFSFPRGRELKIYFLFLIIWIIFLYQITAHATTDGADSILHQSFAARFIRGDYPMHQPWQPDYVGIYHYGGAQLLGAFRALTNAPYYFLHPFFAFLILLFMSQILSWIITLGEKINFITMIKRSIPPMIGLVSLGGFFIAWPAKFELPNFVQHLPVLENAFETYGSPTTIDALVFFIHRLLSISFFTSSVVLLLYPRKNFLSIALLGIFLASLALTDESVFLAVFLPTLLISFFSIFGRNIKVFIPSIALFLIIIILQGGVITETIFNRQTEASNVLIFPEDSPLPHEKYRTYRMDQQKGKFYPNNNSLNWFHPSILWELFLYTLITILLWRKSYNSKLKNLSLLLILSGIISLILFHGLVPNGYTHQNGNRFLALSYYLSGIGIGVIIYFLLSIKIHSNKITKNAFYILVFWILLTSILPPLFHLFPRKKENWFAIKQYTENEITRWVRKNIPADKRIVALTDLEYSNSINIQLVVEAGALTPMWPSNPRVHDSFDIGPTYSDLHFTLNPQSISDLKIDYLLLKNPYIAQLQKERLTDLSNKEFFTPIFISENKDAVILKVNSAYLTQGENYNGTYAEFDKIAPQTGTYCVDYPPNISANTYRILRLILHNRNYYCDKGGAFYNARIDVGLHTFSGKLDQYDYLVLGKDVDPKDVCNCNAKLLWEGLGNGVKFWKTSY